MGPATRVHVANTKHQLPEHDAGSFLGQALVWQLFNVVKKRHAAAQFHHQVDLFGLVNYFEQSHDIRVLKGT